MSADKANTSPYNRHFLDPSAVLLACVAYVLGWAVSLSYSYAQEGDDAYAPQTQNIRADSVPERIRHRSYSSDPVYGKDQKAHPTDQKIIDHYKARADEEAQKYRSSKRSTFSEPPYYARVRAATATDTAVIAHYRRKARAAGRAYLEMNRKADSVAQARIIASRNAPDKPSRRRRRRRGARGWGWGGGWCYDPWAGPGWGAGWRYSPWGGPTWGLGWGSPWGGPGWGGGWGLGWTGPGWGGAWGHRRARNRRHRSASERRFFHRDDSSSPKSQGRRQRSTRRGGRSDRGR